MSKDCGLSAAAEKLNGAIDGAKNAVDDLVGDAVEGIAGSVDGLLDKITGLTDGIKGDLEAAVPEIPIPEAKLQDMMTKMMSTNDPGEMMTQFAEMKEKFGGTPGVDLDKMMDDFGLDSKKLNEGLDDYKSKLDKGNKLKEKLGGVLDKVESVADSDLVKLASGDLSAIGKLADGFAESIFGDGEDKTGLLEKICTKLANVQKEAPTDYVIQKGDTLTSIAKAHETTVQALVELNDIKDPDKILAGDTIKIPGKVVVKAVEGKAPTEDAKPEPEPEETKPKPKADTKPEVEETETQRAQTYVQTSPETEEVEQFNFGPLIRNDAEKSLAYQDDLKTLQDHQTKLNKSVNDYLALQAEFRKMASFTETRVTATYNEAMDNDPQKYLAQIQLQDPVLKQTFVNILNDRIRTHLDRAKGRLNDGLRLTYTEALENGSFKGINWHYFNNDDISYHYSYNKFINLFIINMSIKYGKPGSANTEISFIIGNETYTQLTSKPGEKYFYSFENYFGDFFAGRPPGSTNRENILVNQLDQLTHVNVQDEDPFLKE